MLNLNSYVNIAVKFAIGSLKLSYSSLNLIILKCSSVVKIPKWTKIATTTAKRKWIQRTNHPRQREEHDAPSTFDEQELRRHCSGVAGDFAADGLLYKVFYRRRRIERITTIIWGKSERKSKRGENSNCQQKMYYLLEKVDNKFNL